MPDHSQHGHHASGHHTHHHHAHSPVTHAAGAATLPAAARLTQVLRDRSLMKPVVQDAEPKSGHTAPLRYAVSVAVMAAAVLISVLMGPFISRAIFVLLWPAVIFSAWFGGLGPALVASALGVLAIDFFLIPPYGGLVPQDPLDLVQVAVFTLASVVISRLAAHARASQDRVQAANAELSAANAALQDQATELEQSMEEAQALNEELEVTNEELRVATEGEREARGRLAFLAYASELLASSLDYEATLRRVADLAIERIADWCVVEINDADGRRTSRVVAHRDPDRVRWADEIERRYPPDPEAVTGSPQVLRTGRSELYAHIPDEMLVDAARDAEHLRLFREVGFRGAIVVAIRARERVLGTISFVSSESGRVYTHEDLTLAEDLGRRAGAAIENAELLREAERAADRARRLQAFASALNVAATVEAVAEVAVVHGFEALGAGSGSLALLLEDGQTFEVVHAHGYEAGLISRWRRFPATADWPLSDAVMTGEPILLANAAEIAERFPATSPVMAESGTEAFVAIPLVSAGRPLGALSFSFGAQQEFSEGIRAFLLTLGEQATQALERARLLERERSARESAEAANRAKSDFLSAMSHELRTPLNAIGGYTELLEMEIRGPVTDAQRIDLERIRRAQRHLLALVSDILNFARIEAGRIDYRIGPVPVGPLIVELQELMEPQARAKGLSLERGGGDSDLAVLGDGERVWQILLNLLGNAVKFTDAGGVRIDAEADGDAVRISVVDSGRGIPQDRLEAVFDPFVQVDRGLTAEGQQGIGLGLAISRELAHAMSGTLTATSQPGAGSTFVLTLPRAGHTTEEETLRTPPKHLP